MAANRSMLAPGPLIVIYNEQALMVQGENPADTTSINQYYPFGLNDPALKTCS